MKKLISLVFVFLLTGLSCTKNYTCECERSLDGDVVDTTLTTLRTKKRKAEKHCESLSGLTYSGITQLKETCELKTK